MFAFRGGSKALSVVVALLLTMTMLTASPTVASAGETVVSLTFSPSQVSQYDAAFPILQDHGVNGTFYLYSKTLDATYTAAMVFWQLDEMFRAGNEIGGMTRNFVDLTTVDDATAREEVCSDRARLAELGYDPVNFAYPYAAVNETAKAAVSACGYATGRTIGGLTSTTPAETLPPADPYKVPTRSYTTSAQGLQDAVSEAVATGGGWVPLAFSNVCAASSSDYSTCMGQGGSIDAAEFDAFLDWLVVQPGVSVKTVRAALGLPPPPPLPTRPLVVSLTFDDTIRWQMAAHDALVAHNLRATFYSNSGNIDVNDGSSMTWTQVGELVAAGHDVGGHTKTHVDLTSSGLTYDQKYDEACGDRDRLLEQGANPVGFSYAFGAYNSATQQLIQDCGYSSGRSAGGIYGRLYSEFFPPAVDEFGIRVLANLGLPEGTHATAADLIAAVQRARNHGGGWLPILFHNICWPQGTADYDYCMSISSSMDGAEFSAFLDWLVATNTDVRTISSVMSPGGVVPSRVAITAPVDGTTMSTPFTISGTAGTAPHDGAVNVTIFEGRHATGTPVATGQATRTGATWSISEALFPGTYTAVARQANTYGSLGVSNQATFDVAVSGAPRVNGVEPGSLIQGAAEATLIVTGTEFLPGSSVSIAGEGVSVLATTVQDSSKITAEVTVHPAAAVGPRDVLVTTANGTGRCSGCLTIKAPLTLTSLTPSSLAQGATQVAVRINGTGFEPGAEVSFAGTGVTSTITASSSTSIDLQVSVAQGASTGARDVTVRLSDGRSVTGAPAFTVVAGPTLTSVTPSTIRRNQTVNVQVRGTGFTSGSSISISGGALAISKFKVVDSTLLTFTLKANRQAALGGRSLTVTNPVVAGAGRFTYPDAVTVTP